MQVSTLEERLQVMALLTSLFLALAYIGFLTITTSLH